jgi:hypothetical protein
MNLLPVRKLRIDTATDTHFSSTNLQTFEYNQFEPGTYTKSQLTYAHQSGQLIPYATREEVSVDLIDFTAVQLNALYAGGIFDIEVTLGLPGETATVIYFYSVCLQLNYNITEGVQKLKLSATQFSAGGSTLDSSNGNFGIATGMFTSQITESFYLNVIDCRVGIKVMKLPYRNALYRDVERILGYKRTATITISPNSISVVNRQWATSEILRWLLAEYKFFGMYNFFDKQTDVPRRVVCTNSTEILEDRLDSISAGRNFMIEVQDAELQPPYFAS